MKKFKKIKVYVGIDERINCVFDKHIEGNVMDKGKLIEILIEKYLIEKGLIDKEDILNEINK